MHDGTCCTSYANPCVNLAVLAPVTRIRVPAHMIAMRRSKSSKVLTPVLAVYWVPSPLSAKTLTRDVLANVFPLGVNLVRT
jgi:hypothetical protein